MIPGAQPFIPRTEGGLRRGFTTGSCAAAASKAAAQLLFEDLCAEKVSLLTPKGICLEMEIESREKKEGRASCSVKKYAGDDPDITDGIRICSTVSLDALINFCRMLCVTASFLWGHPAQGMFLRLLRIMIITAMWRKREMDLPFICGEEKGLAA